jgi:glycosyltransferase involved in cell wall biosynthesis
MENKKPAISILIGTYNYLNSLKICLASLERQTFTDFEVIICDDGSKSDVGEWLKSYIPTAPFPLRHMWQEDKGFRKCRLLNQAVQEANAEYILFLDADCIQAKDFIETHWNHKEKGRYLGGRRVMIARKTAENVTMDMVKNGYFDKISLWSIFKTLKGQTRYLEDALPIIHSLRPVHPFNLLGCNFSLHKEDLLKVNGFDEEYESRGGGEDTDVAVRLELVGIKMKSVRYLAKQFHLGHETDESKDVSYYLFKSKLKKMISSTTAKDISSSLLPQQNSAKAKALTGDKKRKKVILLRNKVVHNPGIYFAKGLLDLGVDLVDIPIDITQPQPHREFEKADLLLLVDFGKPVEFPGLENYKYPTGFVSIDSCHKLEVHKKYCEKYAFDFIGVAQKHVVADLGKNAVWLPLAADEDIHIFRPEIMAKDTIWQRMCYANHMDVSMCGAPYPHRRNFKKLFSEAGLSTNFHFRKKFGALTTRELARGTIGFNVGAGYTGDHGKDLNMRVFETMANGQAMLLTNTYPDLGYEDLFEDGVHYIGFTNEKEAVEKAVYFSNNPEAAHTIARNGQNLILNKHTYRHRCQTILKAINLELIVSAAQRQLPKLG